MFRILTITLLALLACFTAHAQSSVLAAGQWYKVAVANHGVYKLTGSQFKKMGFNLNGLDPKKIRIFGNQGGMLPQANATPRINDLSELAIYVDDGGDGKFDNNDFVFFYAEGPDLIRFDNARDIFHYENNLYSDANFYFVNVGNTNGKRMTSSAAIAGSYPIVQRYPDYYYYENDDISIITSGREWFGERFNDGSSIDFEFTKRGMIDDMPVKIVADVMAQAYNGDATFQSTLNGALVNTQVIDGFLESNYGLKGAHHRDTVSILGSSANVGSREDQRLTFHYSKPGFGSGFLDYFLVSFYRQLSLYENQTLFNSGGANSSISTFKIGTVKSSAMVWDITNPYEPLRAPIESVNQEITFSANTSSLHAYVVFNGDVDAPQLVGVVPNQDLHAAAAPELLIIAHPSFEAEANRLAQHRAQHDGLSTYVTTPEKIYHEFSSGRQDVTALRDFIKHLHDQSPGKLKFVLMFGRGSYDYKGHLRSFTNFVPTYESRNSLAPLETYSSDDFFGFLDDEEGEWEESPPIAHDLEIGVGRLPVKSVDEAQVVVNKLIQYDNASRNFGGWRKDIVFVADDGNNADKFTREHQLQANTLANGIESSTPAFNTRKIFLGTYAKVVRPNGEAMPQVNAKIQEDFYRGALLINYTGHGSEHVWADENVFSDDEVNTLENKHYPFLVTATCEFGRQDNPDEISTSELSIIRKNGGTIGLVTTTRPVFSINNYYLNQAFYEALFQRNNGRFRTVGEIFRDTKNNSDTGVGNRNFSLMGDPSMHLALPNMTIDITSLKTSDGSDTLKALSKVIVKGVVKDPEGDTIKTFNGVLESILFDKQTDFVTIGKNNPSFNFKQWYNALYRGKAKVSHGCFSFEMMLPKNIAYEYGEGKLSLYAYDPTTKSDAAGAADDFKVGGSQANPGEDNSPPMIELFMGDTTFLHGGITTPNTTLVVKLQDASGINISNYGIGNNMIATLDGEQTFLLGEYYSAAENTYKIGWVNYPLWNLSPGKHTITVKVWDTHNNPSQASIEFIVSDGEALVVQKFGNYPNPFSSTTTIFFQHNRSGDDLAAELQIFDMTGQQLKSYGFTVDGSSYEVKLLDLDTFQVFGKKLPGGLYLARLAVRSLTNDSKTEVFTKLIVLN